MKEFKKTMAFISAIVAVCILFASCGTEKAKDTDTEVKTEAVQESNEMVNTSEISNDYHSGEIQIEGKVFTLPMKLSDFMAGGWTVLYSSLDDGEMLEAKAQPVTGIWINYESVTVAKGDAKASLMVNNYTDQDINIEDGYLSEIDISKCDVVIPGGFELGKATRDEIKEQWGKADYATESSTGAYMTYNIDQNAEKSYSYLLDFDENDVLESVKLTNENIDPSIASEKKTYLINSDALNEIEKKDGFGVKVLSAEYSENAYNDSYKGAILKIENNTGEKITDVIVLVVGYQDNGELTGLSSLWTNYANYGSDKYVKAVGFNKINADETMEGAIACQSVAGVKAIVYSYEDSNGEKIVNPAAEEWANSVLQ